MVVSLSSSFIFLCAVFENEVPLSLECQYESALGWKTGLRFFV